MFHTVFTSSHQRHYNIRRVLRALRKLDLEVMSLASNTNITVEDYEIFSLEA